LLDYKSPKTNHAKAAAQKNEAGKNNKNDGAVTGPGLIKHKTSGHKNNVR